MYSQLQSGAPWPMFGRNQFHTSNSPFNTNSTQTGILQWNFIAGDMDRYVYEYMNEHIYEYVYINRYMFVYVYTYE